MRHRTSVLGVLVVGAALVIAVQAWAYPQYSRTTDAACVACHVNPAGGASLTEAGTAFKADHEKVPTGKVEGAATYVGGKKCRMCHIKQHKSWAETQHAKAFGRLESASTEKVAAMAAKLKVEVKGAAAKSDACVGCHVTGFQLEGGYPAADSAATAQVIHVTCEGCHGPGSKHAKAKKAEKKATISRAVSAGMCMQCHIPQMSPEFDYEKYKAKGLHAMKAAAK